jgi:hypothetical protein
VTNPELEKFNTVLRKVLSVPREELVRREEEWKRNRALSKPKGAKKASKVSGKT